MASGWIGWNLTLDAWWQPTDWDTVHRILSLAEVQDADTVFDLGCGDGRIVVAAAKEYGARGVGVEIDPLRIAASKIRALLAGVNSNVQLKLGNMYEADLSSADVVILFLSGTANRKLAPKLSRELGSGTRIVSYYHAIPNWKPERTATTRDGYNLYLYRKGGNNSHQAARWST